MKSAAAHMPRVDAIGVSSAGPIMMAAALTLVIYGGYMLVTYLPPAAS